MLENSWNTSVKVMYDLPVQTHRNLIEPISETRHLKFVLLDRFLSFLSQIQKSKKLVPKQLLNFISNDVGSTTGSNLRNLLLLTDKNSIEEINSDDVRSMNYHPIEEKDAWKVNLIKELTNIKYNELELSEFSREELDEILSYVCTS